MSLEISSLTKAYGNKTVLSSLDLSVGGGIFAITGPSGCGKTTLFKILCGLEKYDSGSFRYDGRCSVVFQEARLFPWLNLRENITSVTGCTAKYAEEILISLGLGGDFMKYPHEVSGGMQRRTAIARALSVDAGLYLFDEPLAGLDAELKSVFCEILKSRIEKSKTVLVISHELEEIKRSADRIYTMKDGRLI